MKINMDQHHKAVKRMHWYILFLILAFIGLAWFIFNNQYNLVGKFKGLNLIEDISNQSVFNTKKKGSLIIKSKEDLRRFKLGQPINLQVLADSVGEDIVSFDVLIKYDKEVFEKPTIITNLEQYILVMSDKGEYISITAAQNPGTDERSVFENEEILNINLIPLKVGTYDISILPKQGEELTRLVSANAQPLLPETTTFKIEIY